VVWVEGGIRVPYLWYKEIEMATARSEEEKKQPSAYERLRPFIGIIDTGDPQLSEGTGKRPGEQTACAPSWLTPVLWSPY